MGLELGEVAENRLRREKVGWLTTVRSDRLPQPTPVWFLWDGTTLLIYSKPEAQKIRNLRTHARAAFHLNSDPRGNEILVLWGTAAVDPQAPALTESPAYLAKYRRGIAEIGMTPQSMAAEYSAAIRFRPERVRLE